MSPLPTIYTARSDVDQAHLARVEDWYARRHAPDLIRAGFYTAQVYYSEVGSPLICNLYEIPGPDLFRTQAYRDVAAQDVEGPEVIALLTSRSNTIYDQVLSVDLPAGDADWGTGGRAGAVTAPALSTLRFDVSVADETAFLDWYGSEELRRLRGRPGFQAGRLCRQGPPHPVAASTDPRWFAINEWDGVGAAVADGTAKEVSARLARAPGRLSGLAFNVGRRHFRLARPDA
ncbi:MAG: hypothetical protein ACREJR_13560 [Candidatus Rokuibacteriota bacterium]